LTPAVVPPPAPTFRSIGELAERCGYYCWLEHRLFALTGTWATAPPVAGIEAEFRVLCSEMSLWHGFVAGQWRDRLPVRAGVNPDALIVPSPGALAQALDLLEADTLVADRDLGGAQHPQGAQSPQRALAGLVEHILPALLEAYDEDFAHGSVVCEAPVKALLGLIRPRARLEIAQGRALLQRG
jgi:hypothetical protein